MNLITTPTGVTIFIVGDPVQERNVQRQQYRVYVYSIKNGLNQWRQLVREGEKKVRAVEQIFEFFQKSIVYLIFRMYCESRLRWISSRRCSLLVRKK